MPLPTHDSIAARDTHAGASDLHAAARALIAQARVEHGDALAVVSSFGADSAVLLHLIASVDPAISILFIDTGRHFPETLAYVETLTQSLGLKDVRHCGPQPAEVARLDPINERAGYDPDGCCAFRKVAPLEAALVPFKAWISGRKRFQAETRSSVPQIESADDRVKFNPLAEWSSADVEAYGALHDLPAHPLVAQHYLSIGCAPCTTPVAEGEDARAGRWRSTAKVECGIHVSRIAAPLIR